MPPQRILLLRTSALGDVVHSLPVLNALRRHLPEARIGWVVEEALAPILHGHPALDAVIPVRLRVWRRRPLAGETRREIAAFRRALGQFAPDLAIDLMGNHKAGILAALTRLSGCRVRLGPARPDRREPSSALWINREVPLRGEHAVDRNLSLLDGLGVPPREAGSADFGGELLFPQSPAVPGPPFVLIHPGAGWANKVYPPALWGEAVRRLREQVDLPCRVAVARGEEALADAIVAASGEASDRAEAVPAGDLPALAALLRSATLVLGGDSGPVHLSQALGTPVLMLLGPTDPRRHGPYGAPGRALWKTLPCSFCYRRFAETKACLLEISPALVAERARELLTGL